ncbi:MAG: zeta toxin family protein [Acidimicrobiales bacterium]
MAEERTLRAPEILLLAGPNGAGKTTSSRLVIPEGVLFVNADIVARRLADEGHPAVGRDVAAGRIVLAEIRRLEAQHASFCVETNLAGRGFVRSIAGWHESGYQVRLAFVALDSPELALRRVALRVSTGGHDIPEDVVRRRWKQGLRALFETYIGIVDEWSLTDNSRDQPVNVATGRRSSGTEVIESGLWDMYRRLAAG